ncbi:MAG: addiction module protein [Bacteroidia bacterium]
MSKEYQKVLSGAIALSPSERFSLMRAMLALVEQENVNSNPVEAVLPWETQELFSELDNRLEELQSGKVKAVPGQVIVDKLRTRASQS